MAISVIFYRNSHFFARRLKISPSEINWPNLCNPLTGANKFAKFDAAHIAAVRSTLNFLPYYDGQASGNN